jgi:hypothetical protein
VILELDDLGADGTRVRLTHVIEGEGDDWDAYLQYFDGAWERVLGGFAERFAAP